MPDPSTRDQIIMRADYLFDTVGFAATSLTHIARAENLLRAEIHPYFRIKDDLLEEVITFRIAQTRRMLEDWQERGATPRHRIRFFIHLTLASLPRVTAIGTLCNRLDRIGHPAQVRAAEVVGLIRTWLAEQFQALGAGTGKADAQALHLLVWSQGVAVMASALTSGGKALIRREVADIKRWLDARILPETGIRKT